MNPHFIEAFRLIEVTIFISIFVMLVVVAADRRRK
jgi:hypothetical protein